MKKQVIIIGAGASGVGMGVVLQKMGIDFVILEQNDQIGSSFMKWPQEMRWISPSFTGNFFGVPDLNAITPDSSPAYALGTEHPTGREYAEYVQLVAQHYAIPVEVDCQVQEITKTQDGFTLISSKGQFECDHVIWAGGEYQFPNDKPFDGAEHCLHNSKINSWGDLGGDDRVVIGGYESGIDAAYHLARDGAQVTVIDSADQMATTESDSSYSVSPYTKDRYRQEQENISVKTNTRVERVEYDGDQYIIHTNNGESIITASQPILATGFEGSLGLVESLFEYQDGVPLLTADDESTITPGLFLVGPAVQHGDIVFCFVYKYRQRWPVVGEAIASRVGNLVEAKQVITEYNSMNMYLKDLSCCGDECVC